ncbi:adenine phosphoribosyltransferase [Chloroflexota bacterium]
MNDSNSTPGEFENEFKEYIRDIPDFPTEGIIYRDITNLLKNGEIFKKAVDIMADRFSNDNIDIVCAVEARGFILGAAIAYKLGAGFVPIRKKGKLPWKTHLKSYDLEYGTDQLEVHIDAVEKGHHVLFVDDVLATGGTAETCVEFINQMEGNIVCAAFLIELAGLDGKKKLEGVPIYSLMTY